MCVCLLHVNVTIALPSFIMQFCLICIYYYSTVRFEIAPILHFIQMFYAEKIELIFMVRFWYLNRLSFFLKRFIDYTLFYCCFQKD